MSLPATATGVGLRKTRRCLVMLRTLLLSPGQQQLPFAFDVRLNQIPEEWHQVAVRFRKTNGIRDGDSRLLLW